MAASKRTTCKNCGEKLEFKYVTESKSFKLKETGDLATQIEEQVDYNEDKATRKLVITCPCGFPAISDDITAVAEELANNYTDCEVELQPTDASKCPDCGVSGEFQTYVNDGPDCGSVGVTLKCEACGKTWDENYSLTGRTES